jgi:hypothetical protein
MLTALIFATAPALGLADCGEEVLDARNASEVLQRIELLDDLQTQIRCLERLELTVISSTATDVEKANFIEEIHDLKEVQQSRTDFAALGFGIAVGYSFGLGGDRVESAEVVNNIVRVSEDNTDEARVLSEAHWFFTPWGYDIGIGPYASISTSQSSEGIGSFGLGLMIGFRDKSNQSSKSWNIGVGIIFDSDVKVLGDGISENAPLPPGENPDTVRLKEESKPALVVLVSRGFG